MTVARTVISIVVTGAVAEEMRSAWPANGDLPESFRRRLEEALYQSAPSSVSRSRLQRAARFSAAHLG